MSLKFIVPCKDNVSFKNVVLAAPSGCLCVIDAYSEWCGPCEALNRKLQALYMDMSEYDIKFVQAMADSIDCLAEQAQHSKPLFLFYKDGQEIARLEGANACEMMRMVEANAERKEL
mmetsp:Transcript_43031/g.71523  ORF Transcript_43031/g.71523 Transcript_43031/m.71523 type:complete len:117 (-) Transcript_43031:216-566(-)|eukprot:CAMPEP_0119320130 /NCGR_PEP_ID=MMETSP1333-20130426/51567_1 /TAXON_ID=418940 /ORGANISM="Scyphosphaera apsteinii, Strain RCC1455" /LENGTH=116 /DNA_ID=CAMNT_0007326767 /DNA_START=77 /DNA_END=427 /DNA_ORIENTATION=-